MLQRSILCMQGAQYATKRRILCRGAFCGSTGHLSHGNTVIFLVAVIATRGQY